MGERLQYAHLSDSIETTEPANGAASGHPPADDNGLPYDSDLLALVGIGDRTDRATTVAPNPELEAELDGSTATLARCVSTDMPVTVDPEETQ